MRYKRISYISYVFLKSKLSKRSEGFPSLEICICKVHILVQKVSVKSCWEEQLTTIRTQDRKTMLPSHHLLLSDTLKMETYYVVITIKH